MPNTEKSPPIVGYEDDDVSIRLGCILEWPGNRLSISPLCRGEKCLHYNDRNYTSKEICAIFQNNPLLKKEWRSLWAHFKRYRDEKEIAEPYQEDRSWYFK